MTLVGSTALHPVAPGARSLLLPEITQVPRSSSTPDSCKHSLCSHAQGASRLTACFPASLGRCAGPPRLRRVVHALHACHLCSPNHTAQGAQRSARAPRAESAHPEARGAPSFPRLGQRLSEMCPGPTPAQRALAQANVADTGTNNVGPFRGHDLGVNVQNWLLRPSRPAALAAR